MSSKVYSSVLHAFLANYRQLDKKILSVDENGKIYIYLNFEKDKGRLVVDDKGERTCTEFEWKSGKRSNRSGPRHLGFLLDAEIEPYFNTSTSATSSSSRPAYKNIANKRSKPQRSHYQCLVGLEQDSTSPQNIPHVPPRTPKKKKLTRVSRKTEKEKEYGIMNDI